MMTEEIKYPMPALTEEERAETIACTKCILGASWANEAMRNVARVALAALTAKPRGRLIQSVNPKSGDVAIFYRERGISSISPEEIAEWEMSEVESLYDAPPVPTKND